MLRDYKIRSIVDKKLLMGVLDRKAHRMIENPEPVLKNARFENNHLVDNLEETQKVDEGGRTIDLIKATKDNKQDVTRISRIKTNQKLDDMG